MLFELSVLYTLVPLWLLGVLAVAWFAAPYSKFTRANMCYSLDIPLFAVVRCCIYIILYRLHVVLSLYTYLHIYNTYTIRVNVKGVCMWVMMNKSGE